MKKLLGILVLGLLLSGNAYAACVFNCPTEKTLLEKLKNNIDDLNPINYFEKRKKCQARADRADTVAAGKRRFKYCMDNYPD